MSTNAHKYLKNNPSSNDGFKKKRGFTPPPEDEEKEEPPKIITPTQKDKLRLSNALLFRERKVRLEEKKLGIPGNIELVRIYFLTVFNLDLQKKFLERYGLSVLEYTDFNRTVLFEITSEVLFQKFLEHIKAVVESPADDSYENKPYNLIALIFNFEFYTDKSRLGQPVEGGFLINLISSINSAATDQKKLLLEYINVTGGKASYYDVFPDIVEVSGVDRAIVSSIVKNFDIVRRVSGTRPIKIRPGAFGAVRRTYGFEVEVPDNLPIVGIIDTGVNNIEPFRNLITNIHYEHTNKGAYWDESGHGTMIAGLIVFGAEFLTEVRSRYSAKARIAVIKTIHNDDDHIDIPRLLNDIRDARRRHGIRLFNMSLNLNIVKKYNSSFGSFAYELDKLEKEEDLIVVMSVGNYKAEDLQKLLNEDYHPAHAYPRFFYDLQSTSEHHNCWFTNIQEPSESLNNISVGAIAGNVEDTTHHDSTPASEYPAYYSRKWHFDHSQPVNGTALRRNQNNKHLNKPDMVYDGGDLFEFDAGIEVLHTMIDDPNFFGRSCGTSLAAALITSKAADILFYYPNLKTQSVKALMLNNCFSPAGNNPPDFQGLPINVYKKLTGAGKPDSKNLLLTDNNTATWIIEDIIGFNDLITIPVKLPAYLRDAGNKLHFAATLCYDFIPVKDNHLNYLPLHISFGIFKNMDASSIASSDATAYRIKNQITWSEDFFGVENRLFSNTQKIEFNLQPADFSRLGDEISIAVRCTGKLEIPEANRQYIEESDHRFSIVITLSEIPENRARGMLYAELNAINEVDNIVTIDLDLQAEDESDIREE